MLTKFRPLTARHAEHTTVHKYQNNDVTNISQKVTYVSNISCFARFRQHKLQFGCILKPCIE